MWTLWRGALMGGMAATLVGRVAPAQEVRLVLRDSLTAQPVSDATVTLSDERGDVAASGFTRRDGAIVLRPRSPGSYAVFVRKLGFSPRASDYFDVPAAGRTERVLQLWRIPQFLADVAIRAEQDDIRSGTLFGMRIGTIGAVIISPTQVDRAVLGARDLTDLVSRNPSAGHKIDYEAKCVLSNRGWPEMCLPVIVDGVVTNMSGDVIPPEIVDYILILRGHETGMMYGTIGELGAVLVFTKRGGRRGPRP